MIAFWCCHTTAAVLRISYFKHSAIAFDSCIVILFYCFCFLLLVVDASVVSVTTLYTLLAIITKLISAYVSI